MNNMKENLHIILYFLNCNEKRAFTKLELPIFEEIIEHESSKIIYVITHSSPNMQAKIKKKVYDRINSGIQGITQIDNIIDKFKASENNVVFVNFHKNDINGDKIFGQKELFKKIHDFFIESDDYKNSLKELDEEQMELQISKLRKQAEDIIYWHKCGASIPIIGGYIYFFIKKDAIKKIEKVFALDSEFSIKIIKNYQINQNNQNSIIKIIGKGINILPEFLFNYGLIIRDINLLLDTAVNNYKAKKNDLINTYLQASDYFQS